MISKKHHLRGDTKQKRVYSRLKSVDLRSGRHFCRKNPSSVPGPSTTGYRPVHRKSPAASPTGSIPDLAVLPACMELIFSFAYLAQCQFATFCCSKHPGTADVKGKTYFQLLITGCLLKSNLITYCLLCSISNQLQVTNCFS